MKYQVREQTQRSCWRSICLE